MMPAVCLLCACSQECVWPRQNSKGIFFQQQHLIYSKAVAIERDIYGQVYVVPGAGFAVLQLIAHGPQHR